MSGGEIESYGEGYLEFDEDSEIIFATDFYSNSIENFEFGTFDIATFDTEYNFDNSDSFAFETFIDVLSDENGNEASYEAVSGTISIEDNGDNNYTVTVDGTFEKFTEEDYYSPISVVDIAFTFTGNFTYNDQREF